MGQKRVTYTRSCAYSIQYHIVFCTKYRKKVLTNDIMSDLIEYTREIARQQKYTIHEINGEPDHIHLLISATPTTSIPALVKQIKGATAREMFKQHPELRNQLWGGHLWSPSYFVGTTNENTSEQIAQYIQKQGDKQ